MSQISKEQRLIHDATAKLRKAIFERTEEITQAEFTHQNIAAANTVLIAHYEDLLGVYRINKEQGQIVLDMIKGLEKLIDHYQAIEGHSFEAIKDAKSEFEDFVNLATLQNNLEVVLMNRIKQLKAGSE